MARKMTLQQRVDRLIRILDLCASEFEGMYPNPTDAQEEWAGSLDYCLKELEEDLQRDLSRQIDRSETEPAYPYLRRVSTDNTVITRGWFQLARYPDRTGEEHFIEMAPATRRSNAYFDRYWLPGQRFRLTAGGIDVAEFELMRDVQRNSNNIYSGYIEFRIDNEIPFNRGYHLQAVERPELLE